MALRVVWEYHHDKGSIAYSHTTWNKAIQYFYYYYYYLIWSWLYSEILTLLMYTVYVGLHWCKLTSLTTVINIAYRSRQDQTSLCWLTNSFLANYCCTYVTTIVKHCTLPGCLYIWWFLWILLGKSQRKFHVTTSCQSCFVWAQFLHSQVNRCATIRGSIKFSLNHFCERSTWILRFCNA